MKGDVYLTDDRVEYGCGSGSNRGNSESVSYKLVVVSFW